MPDGSYVMMVLVDRTCLGVKNAIVSPPVPIDEVEGLLDRLEDVHAGGGRSRARPVGRLPGDRLRGKPGQTGEPYLDRDDIRVDGRRFTSLT
jgi:hypothetical protein